MGMARIYWPYKFPEPHSKNLFVTLAYTDCEPQKAAYGFLFFPVTIIVMKMPSPIKPAIAYSSLCLEQREREAPLELLTSFCSTCLFMAQS